MVSTLVVCGGLPLLVHAMVAPASGPLASTPLSVCFFAADSSGHPALINSATINDPDDSSDDDGDDDAPGGDAAITVDAHQHAVAVRLAEEIHVPAQVWISRSQDGHALRGPPASDHDDSLSDYDDDDDDDQDDSDDSEQLKSLRAAPAASAVHAHTAFTASPDVARDPISLSRGHALRAPPVRVL